MDRNSPKFKRGSEVEAFEAMASWLLEERERLARQVRARALALGWNAEREDEAMIYQVRVEESPGVVDEVILAAASPQQAEGLVLLRYRQHSPAKVTQVIENPPGATMRGSDDLRS